MITTKSNFKNTTHKILRTNLNIFKPALLLVLLIITFTYFFLLIIIIISKFNFNYKTLLVISIKISKKHNFSIFPLIEEKLL